MGIRIPFTNKKITLRITPIKRKKIEHEPLACSSATLDQVMQEQLDLIEKLRNSHDTIPFKHSGKLGDIIYSTPIIKAIAKDKKILLFIDIDQNNRYPELNIGANGFNSLKPFLEIQGINAEVYQNQKDVINLDLFRETKANQIIGRSHIARWYHYTFPFAYSYQEKYLQAGKDEKYKDSIIVCRSFRNNNPEISYDILDTLDNVIFLGLKEEYEALGFSKVKYYNTRDFCEVATMINSCKFFVGNQTFLTALADGLNVKRVLELTFSNVDVTTSSPYSYEALCTTAFNYGINELNK